MKKQICTAFSLLAASLIANTVPTAHADTVSITGAGSTFGTPIYTKWFAEYNKVNPNVQFNYQSIGSGGGQRMILAKTVDFGASDGPMSDAQLKKAPGKILHIPTVAGAVVIMYNLPGDLKLKFDGKTLANIFLGKITKWNDPAIAALNPGVKLPDMDILVVHRSDGSGTSYIFTDYLSSVSAAWAKKVGKNTAVKWPIGIGAKGSDGVSGQVRQIKGAIGYVELIYALQNHIAFAKMKNRDGNFVEASTDSVTAAMATAKIPSDFRFSIVNPPGKNAYPISGATWLLIYQNQTDHAKGKDLVSFLKWEIANGAASAKALNYAPLPKSLEDRVLKKVDTIKF